MLTLFIFVLYYLRKQQGFSSPKGINMKAESKLKLNSITAFQTHSALYSFVILSAMVVTGAGIHKTADIIKSKEKYQVKSGDNYKLNHQYKTEITKELLLVLVAFAVVFVCAKSISATKRYNDTAAVRAMRRYLIQLRKEIPELKKYDNVLNNEMALHNIAAGVANRLPFEELYEFSAEWDWVYAVGDGVIAKTVDELKIKNKALKFVIESLQKHAEKDPTFMEYLIELVGSSAKTFALDKYMPNQKVR